MRIRLYLIAVFSLGGVVGRCEAQDPKERAGWEWSHRPQTSHAVVAVFEESSGRIKDVYTLPAGRPCWDPAPTTDSALVSTGAAFLQGVGWGPVYPGQNSVTRHGDDVVIVDYFAGDPSARVVFHPDGGVLFAASSMWMGSGDQLWPSDPLAPWVWRAESGLAPEPVRVTAVDAVPDTIVTSFRRLNVIHEFASEPYSVAAFLYNREGQPWLLDASWIVIGLRTATCP